MGSEGKETTSLHHRSIIDLRRSIIYACIDYYQSTCYHVIVPELEDGSLNGHASHEKAGRGTDARTTTERDSKWYAADPIIWWG